MLKVSVQTSCKRVGALPVRASTDSGEVSGDMPGWGAQGSAESPGGGASMARGLLGSAAAGRSTLNSAVDLLFGMPACASRIFKVLWSMT